MVWGLGLLSLAQMFLHLFIMFSSNITIDPHININIYICVYIYIYYRISVINKVLDGDIHNPKVEYSPLDWSARTQIFGAVSIVDPLAENPGMSQQSGERYLGRSLRHVAPMHRRMVMTWKSLGKKKPTGFKTSFSTLKSIQNGFNLWSCHLAETPGQVAAWRVVRNRIPKVCRT
jgi:hypothetical protein